MIRHSSDVRALVNRLCAPAAGEERTMSRIERSIVIARPIDALFRYVHDPANDASWQTTLIESTQLDEGPVGVGTQIRERRRFLGIQVEMTKEVTEYEPPTRSSFRMVSGGAPMSGEYLLQSEGAATKLTAIGYVEPRGFFQWAEPLFTAMAGRELEASLGHLKDLVEMGPGDLRLPTSDAPKEAIGAPPDSGAPQATSRSTTPADTS
jgi:hypothetical protein